jgi:hypothetical protein
MPSASSPLTKFIFGAERLMKPVELAFPELGKTRVGTLAE